MAKPKQKYYAVWVGKTPGLYLSWADCERQVKGIEGAKYKSFSTKEEAELALAGPPDEYFSKTLSRRAQQHELSLLPEALRPRFPSIAVDAACSGNPGQMEYQGVDAETGKPIFHQGPFLHGTNNIGEFLAIVHALALLKKLGQDQLPIYSDSITAQSWVRQRQCKTKLKVNEQNRRLMDIVARAEAWLHNNTYNNPILKWQTDKWGEIPADFGRK